MVQIVLEVLARAVRQGKEGFKDSKGRNKTHYLEMIEKSKNQQIRYMYYNTRA